MKSLKLILFYQILISIHFTSLLAKTEIFKSDNESKLLASTTKIYESSVFVKSQLKKLDKGRSLSLEEIQVELDNLLKSINQYFISSEQKSSLEDACGENQIPLIEKALSNLKDQVDHENEDSKLENDIENKEMVLKKCEEYQVLKKKLEFEKKK